MAFIVEHKVGGTTYVYQSVGYWDKEKSKLDIVVFVLGKRILKQVKLFLLNHLYQPADVKT
jgi:hypothetical protein